jgi:predicted RNA binding protein YcfA (HicA-like mRNA interferase family)
MKVPRDLSSTQLIRLLSNFGYETTRQTGSHIRLTTQSNGQHHITIPAHDPLKIGTLNAVLRSVSEHLGLTKDDLLEQMFGEQS